MMRTPDTTPAKTPQQHTPPKRIHTAITLSPEVLSRIDKECDARRGVYVYEKSRSTVIENYLRDAYGMPRIEFGRKVKKIDMNYLTDPVKEPSVSEPPKAPESTNRNA